MSERAQAVEMIEQERQRQITAEGYTAQHDAAHDPARLAAAGECYRVWAGRGPSPYGGTPGSWPWATEFWKPKTLVRDLVRSGALFLAAEAAQRARLAEMGDNAHGWGAAEADGYHASYERVAKELAWELGAPISQGSGGPQ